MLQAWRRYFQNKFIVAVIALIFAIALSAIISLFKAVETHSLLEQESLTPAFGLLSQEILKPLYIAETIARSSSIKTQMNSSDIDQEAIQKKLSEISQEFDMEFFVASELNRTQYNSDGSTLSLEVDSVEWYFNAKNNDLEIVGMLGKRDDIRIYFDVKIYNAEGTFLGFVGVNRKLTSFMEAFDNFKKQFGYDFIFVDHNNNIVLSSDDRFNADGKRIMRLEQLAWYSAFSAQQKNNSQLKNYLVEVENEDVLIAQANLDSLNWKMFLVNPLKTRQAAATEKFIAQTIIVTIAIFTGILIVYLVIRSLQGEFARRHQNDPLTQLPNRAQLFWQYDKVAKKGKNNSIIIVDIDHFKSVNDTYGHSAGDFILCEVAKILQQQLRDNDVVARWGGEEFVILLPAANKTITQLIAERTRAAIAKHIFEVDKKIVKITASFGNCTDNQKSSLNLIIAQADEALYKAKNGGRNKVCSANQPIHSIPAKIWPTVSAK